MPRPRLRPQHQNPHGCSTELQTVQISLGFPWVHSAPGQPACNWENPLFVGQKSVPPQPFIRPGLWHSMSYWQRRKGDTANMGHLPFCHSWLLTFHNNKTSKRLNPNWACDCNTVDQILEELHYILWFGHWSPALKLGLKYHRDTGYWIYKKQPRCRGLLSVSEW